MTGGVGRMLIGLGIGGRMGSWSGALYPILKLFGRCLTQIISGSRRVLSDIQKEKDVDNTR